MLESLTSKGHQLYSTMPLLTMSVRLIRAYSWFPLYCQQYLALTQHHSISRIITQFSSNPSNQRNAPPVRKVISCITLMYTVVFSLFSQILWISRWNEPCTVWQSEIVLCCRWIYDFIIKHKYIIHIYSNAYIIWKWFSILLIFVLKWLTAMKTYYLYGTMVKTAIILWHNLLWNAVCSVLPFSGLVGTWIYVRWCTYIENNQIFQPLFDPGRIWGKTF